MQRAVADDLGEAAIEIDARREAHVDADGAQLGRHEPAARRRPPSSARSRSSSYSLPERAQRRQAEERLAEALHAAAFLIDGDEQRRLANRVDLGNQRRELLEAREIALEQDDPADERRLEPLALVGARSRYRASRSSAGPATRSLPLRRQAMSTIVPAATLSNSSTMSLLRHADAADRAGHPERLRVRRAVDIDVAAHCIDLPEPVPADFRARQPQNPRQDPVAVRDVARASAAE